MRLRESARFLLTSLGGGRECDYGSGHKPREAFHAHYSATSAVLGKWDALLKAYIGCSGSLKERIWDEARQVASASEGRWSITLAQIAAYITDSTQSRAKNDELEADFSLGENAPHWAIPLRDDDEAAEDWDARIERNIARIEAFGRASQSWPKQNQWRRLTVA